MGAAQKIESSHDEIGRADAQHLLEGLQPAAALKAQRAAPAPQRFDLRALKVAVVEDSMPSRELIMSTLRGFGVSRSHAFRSVKEAMGRLETEAFDLVIVDAEMPGEDGYDLTRRLRAKDGPNHTVAVVLASGHTPLSKIARARDIGANMVILKPIAPAVLLSHIEWLARTPRPFVSSSHYNGPCRRVRHAPLPPGAVERRADAQPHPEPDPS